MVNYPYKKPWWCSHLSTNGRARLCQDAHLPHKGQLLLGTHPGVFVNLFNGHHLGAGASDGRIYLSIYLSDGWFASCFFHHIWDNPSHWRTHIFQDGYCTNQIIYIYISHRIHGAGIYGNIYHQYTTVMLAYIPAPWIRHGIWIRYIAWVKYSGLYSMSMW